MIVKYVGPHRGGLQQIGRKAVTVTWGQPFELDDELAEKILSDAPEHWERIAKNPPAKKGTKVSDDQPEEGDES